MYLSSVRIQNYRSLKDISVALSPFTCIIGENNCGKSSTLLSLSLFISGSKISNKEFHDSTRPIRIEVEIKNIDETDLKRLSEDHRKRIVEKIDNSCLKLVRIYETNGSSNVYYRGLGPKNEKLDFSKLKESNQLKGKKGKELLSFIQAYLPEYKDDFEKIKSQKNIEEVFTKIIEKLDPNEMEEKDLILPTGFWNSIKPLLPEPILIPAVKDITDDVKTTESATFGKLLGVLLSLIEDAEEFKDILESFETLKGYLNKVETDGKVVDDRLDEVKNIELILEEHIQENFPNVNIDIIIPPPGLKKIFSGVEIQIDDGMKSSIDYKGDGLKRAVTFALLRTYVEQKNTFKESDNSKFLFLFEEPELYLHPKAQRILKEYYLML